MKSVQQLSLLLLALCSCASALDAGRRRGITGPLRMHVEQSTNTFHTSPRMARLHKARHASHGAVPALGFGPRIRGITSEEKRHVRRAPSGNGQHGNGNGTASGNMNASNSSGPAVASSSSSLTTPKTTYTAQAAATSTTFNAQAATTSSYTAPAAAATTSSYDDDSCDDSDDDTDEDDCSDDTSSADVVNSATAAYQANAATNTATFTSTSSQSQSTSSSSSQVYTGEATFYYQNNVAGACGTVAQDSDTVVALFTAIYANGANCGRQVQITNTDTGASVTATVRDECPSCTDSGHIDLSTGAFTQIGSESTGLLNTEWKFIS